MSTEAKMMHAIRCDHFNGCSAELETYEGGAWLYDNADEARVAAYDADWATDGAHDYCPRHRDDLAEDETIVPQAPHPGAEALLPGSAERE